MLHALALSLFAAVAVDLGFGAAFVDDTVGYLITVYFSMLVAILVGRGGAKHWSRHLMWRLPLALVTALLLMVSLRSWALFELSTSAMVTSGHSPYFVLPMCALVSSALYVLLPLKTQRAVEAKRELAK